VICACCSSPPRRCIAVLVERRMIGASHRARAARPRNHARHTAFALPRALTADRASLAIFMWPSCSRRCSPSHPPAVSKTLTYELHDDRRLETAREECCRRDHGSLTRAQPAVPRAVQERELKPTRGSSSPLALFIDVDKFRRSTTRSATTPAIACCSTSRGPEAHIREADYVFRWGRGSRLITCARRGAPQARC